MSTETRFVDWIVSSFRFWVILGLMALIRAICGLFTPKVEVSSNFFKEGEIPLSCSERRRFLLGDAAFGLSVHRSMTSGRIMKKTIKRMDFVRVSGVFFLQKNNK